MVGGLVANDIDDRCLRAARIMEIGQAVGQARAAVQQRGGGLARHARITIGGAGHHAFKQAQHAAHAGNAVQRRHEVHLAGAGVGEAGVHAACQQRLDEAFGAVH